MTPLPDRGSLMISEFAPAKVNLYLHVTGRRADGYHELDSLAVFAGVGDVVTAADGPLALTVSGRFGGALAVGDDNLVLRAARALDPGGAAVLHLEKRLPVASGIGGGSADAAAALRALARLWGSDVDLSRLALALGADVPVCVASLPMRMRGIGELLAPAPALPACGLVLVNPGVAVPTPAVFRARTGGFSEPAVLPAGWAHAGAMAADLAACRNDLQDAAISIAPVIGDVLAVLSRLPGVLLARMSGSGATCFGLFETPAAAAAAAAMVQPAAWWRWGGGLYEPARTDI
jgi:4-diphosphocytidyl-2-C-methyl-D-erythritol kinase